jgi:putative membrane protein
MKSWGVWNVSPPICVLLVGSAALYAWGVKALWSGGHRARGVGPLRVWCFAGGLAAVAWALVSPLDHAAGELLSAHMGQHLVLVLMAAPLLVLGRPGLVAMAVLPPSLRRSTHAVFASAPARWAAALLSLPVVAWLVHVGAIWAWHVPGAYQAALQHEPVHWLEHGSFLSTAMLFWWVALEPGTHRRLARGGDVLYLLAAWIQSGALGALFTFAAVPVYPLYAVQAARMGVDPLRDQQLAGVIMWVPAGVVYLGAACALFVSWLRRVERESPLTDPAVDVPQVART